MLLHYLRNAVGVLLIAVVAVFHRQRQPPQLHLHTLRVESGYHLLNGIARESVRARLPVPVIVEPSVIKRGPMNTEFFQIGDRFDHLSGRKVVIIAPAAPANGVVLIVIGWLR